MSADYYTLVTDIGQAKLTNALALGTAVRLTHFAVGDGGGAVYNPTQDQSALKNEVYRAPINAIATDEANPTWLTVEAVIPATEGGWTVREAGVFDADGDLIAIAKYPESVKPALAAGVGKDLYCRLILQHGNVEVVTLKVDPAIVLATREFVQDAIAAHDADPNAHLANIPHDISFNAGLGADGTAQDLAVQRLGRIVVGRSMTAYGEVIDMEGAADNGDAEFDIHVNGVPIYSVLPTVAEGAMIETAGTIDGGSIDLSRHDVVECFCTKASGKLASFTLLGHLR